jgi:hypothetical protein
VKRLGKHIGRLLDFVIYLLIGFLVAIGLYWAAVLGVVSEDSLVKWVGISVFTVVLFGWVIKDSRRFWPRTAFWWIIVMLLAVHAAAFLIIFRYVEHWRMAWFLVICTLEVIPVTAILDWTMRRKN